MTDQGGCQVPRDIAEKGITLLVDINRTPEGLCKLQYRDISMTHLGFGALGPQCRLSSWQSFTSGSQSPHSNSENVVQPRAAGIGQ